MKNIVVLSGAGISAESGIKTFRDANGLWEGFDIMEVASPEGWEKNPKRVLEFYNQRRKQATEVKPNAGHLALAKLEKQYNVSIITQNVDDLHERAGSHNILHLHGELFKSRSVLDENLVYDIKGWELNIGDLCEKGGQLRPHIVWFGEMVPKMSEAIDITTNTDIFIIVGTSLVVYPAAGLIDYVKPQAEVFVIDPKIPAIPQRKNIHLIEQAATIGLVKLVDDLMNV